VLNGASARNFGSVGARAPHDVPDLVSVPGIRYRRSIVIDPPLGALCLPTIVEFVITAMNFQINVTDNTVGEFLIVGLKLDMNSFCLDNVANGFASGNRLTFKIYQQAFCECEDILP
jgi:hypothetical protein